MATYINTPVIVLFIEDSDRMPRYWHKTMATALPEASRLLSEFGKPVHFIEYGKVPKVLGFMGTDGVMHEDTWK